MTWSNQFFSKEHVKGSHESTYGQGIEQKLNLEIEPLIQFSKIQEQGWGVCDHIDPF